MTPTGVRASSIRGVLIVEDHDDTRGVELVRALTTMSAAKSIPVIVLSSFDEDAAREKMSDVASHVRVFLTKPFALSALLDAIAGCVESADRP